MSPDTRRHRGAHPSDGKLFHSDHLPALREATADLSWLLSRGYAAASSLKMVGDRRRLSARQRAAVARAACSDDHLRIRAASALPFNELKDKDLVIDGLNLLITIEAALSGAVLIRCRDGCIRDLSSVHGSYRSVEETGQAIRMVGQILAAAGPSSVEWLLDRPVSNSGRLALMIRGAAAEGLWPWTVELKFNPDREMIGSTAVVISSDSVILDQAAAWFNLAALLVLGDAGCNGRDKAIADPWVVDLSC